MSKNITVIFGEYNGIIYRDTPPPREFSWGGQHFSCDSGNDFSGFYDWHKNSDGKVVSVKFWPFEDFSYLLQFETTSNLIILDGKSMRLLLNVNSASPLVDSDDQCFGDNFVYKTRNQFLAAISFGLYGLSDDEIKSLVIMRQP